MAQGKAEDAGGLTPAKDDNTALYHFAPELYRFSSVSTIIQQESPGLRTAPVKPDNRQKPPDAGKWKSCIRGLPHKETDKYQGRFHQSSRRTSKARTPWAWRAAR